MASVDDVVCLGWEPTFYRGVLGVVFRVGVIKRPTFLAAGHHAAPGWTER
jgi:hypothetical protein